MRRQTNSNLLKDLLQKAIYKSAEQLDEAFQETLSEERYWKGFEDSTTKRQNGETVVGAYRNIVDSSDLKNSQTMSISKDGSTITYTWGSTGNTPAQAVFYGHRTSKGFVPGRDWVTPAIAETNLPIKFKKNFKS